MSMHGYDLSFYDYGFSDPVITRSLYGNLLSPISATFNRYDDDYDRRRPPPRPIENPSSPPKHRHDGSSPLPLGMDWSLPPRLWDGRDSIWPHDSHTGWSYCVTIPSWTILPSASGSDTVFFRVQVGIQSPEGITTTRGVLRRFNEFLKLHYELGKEFPKKKLPLTPPRRLMKMRSKTLLEERRCALEDWMEKLLSDIDVSRTALVAIFLELEAAARSSFYESNQNESVADSAHRTVLSDQSFPNSGASLLESGSCFSPDMGNSSDYVTSNLGAPRPEKENHADRNTENAYDRGVTGSVSITSRGESSVNLIDDLRQVSAEGGIARKFSYNRIESNVDSVGACQTSNMGLKSSLGDSRLEPPENAGSQEGDLVVALTSEEHQKENKVLITMEQRLGTTKMDAEDLIARLNKEIVARQNLATKVKNLEVELETKTQSSKENLQQAILTERDIEKLQRKCIELEMKLAIEQDARVHVESLEASLIHQNKMLMKELDDAKKQQVESLKKQHNEVELKSKSDVKLLCKEVESIRTSHLELKQELNRCLEEKHELEKEKQRWEVGNASKAKLLHECEVLRKWLQECSVNFLVEEQDKLTVNASSSDAIDLLATSDTQISLILAEAQLLAKTTAGAANQDDNGDGLTDRDDHLRMLLADIFSENAKLRKQVNSVIRQALSKPGGTSRVDLQEETVIHKFLDK